MIQLKTGAIVPCGKCPACLANQRQEWIFRLKQEFRASCMSLFVTFTYDNEHLPKDLSVNKRDVQLFHKRLRKHFKSQDLRYYLVSEYGDHTHRPHYHGLYFFRSQYDKKFVYDTFSESWANGFLYFGDVEEGSIVYCTKYCLKHSKTPEGRKPTFRLLSKMNGGLGSIYLDEMRSWHEQTQNSSFVAYDGKLCRMPKYYKDKILFLSDKFERYSDQIQSYSDDFVERFRKYCLTHHYDNFEQAKIDFMEFEKKSHQERDSLIVKHCKKQKF